MTPSTSGSWRRERTPSLRYARPRCVSTVFSVTNRDSRSRGCSSRPPPPPLGMALVRAGRKEEARAAHRRAAAAAERRGPRSWRRHAELSSPAERAASVLLRGARRARAERAARGRRCRAPARAAHADLDGLAAELQAAREPERARSPGRPTPSRRASRPEVLGRVRMAAAAHRARELHEHPSGAAPRPARRARAPGTQPPRAGRRGPLARAAAAPQPAPPPSDRRLAPRKGCAPASSGAAPRSASSRPARAWPHAGLADPARPLDDGELPRSRTGAREALHHRGELRLPLDQVGRPGHPPQAYGSGDAIESAHGAGAR